MDIGQKKQIKIEISSNIKYHLDNQNIVIFLSQGDYLTEKSVVQIDQHLDGVISRSIKEGKIRGIYGETVLIASEGIMPSPKILLLGLGQASLLTCEKIKELGNTVFQTLLKIHVLSFSTFLPIVEAFHSDYSLVVENFFDGIISSFLSMVHPPDTTLTIFNDEEREIEIIIGLNRLRSIYNDKLRLLISRGEL